MTINFFDLSYEETEKYFLKAGYPSYRVKQLWHGIYKELKPGPESISTLPKVFLNDLLEKFRFTSLQQLNILHSSDHETEKALFQLTDQLAIETVHMSYHERDTICVSTQAGCAMNCAFCATGQMGFQRNLSAGEIVEQVIFFQRILLTKGKKITNLVFMGMGEPFQNYDAFLKAADILNHAEGLQLGERRMTVSTVGLPDMILKFAEENRQINLAISLHAVDDEKRSAIIPINRRYPVSDVLAACKTYLQKTNRRVTFEYALMRGYNDSPADAKALAAKIHGMLCHVNLINLNPVEGSAFQPTTPTAANEFMKVLETIGIPVSMRLRRGIDIHAGCGQLASLTKQS
jgi:23S rRNA (adenine2503-C2)-methyltransferase